jgi:hypothetical protein
MATADSAVAAAPRADRPPSFAKATVDKPYNSKHDSELEFIIIPHPHHLRFVVIGAGVLEALAKNIFFDDK